MPGINTPAGKTVSTADLHHVAAASRSKSFQLYFKPLFPSGLIPPPGAFQAAGFGRGFIGKASYARVPLPPGRTASLAFLISDYSLKTVPFSPDSYFLIYPCLGRLDC